MGWLFCDGRFYSIAAYPNLYAAIGSQFNPVGIPGGQFAVPDMRGRVVAGMDNMGGISANVMPTYAADILGGVVGVPTVSLSMLEVPSHRHTFVDYVVGVSSGGSYQGPSAPLLNYQTMAGPTTYTDINTAGGYPHENVQPTFMLLAIIKV